MDFSSPTSPSQTLAKERLSAYPTYLQEILGNVEKAKAEVGEIMCDVNNWEAQRSDIQKKLEKVCCSSKNVVSKGFYCTFSNK